MREDELKDRTKAPPGHVVLAGFMGTGKTQAGIALAALLGRPFADLDDRVEARAKMSIARLFQEQGEPAFRALEREAIAQVCGEKEAMVIAAGGGALLDEANRRCLQDAGTVILLEASPEVLASRLAKDRRRPLLEGAPEGPDRVNRIRELLESRKEAYAAAKLRIDTTFLTPDASAHRIAALLNLPSETILLPFPEGAFRPHPGADARPGDESSRIEIGRGLLSNLGRLLRSAGLGPRVFLFLPPVIEQLYLPQIAASLEAEKIPWDKVSVRDGEADKSLDQASDLLEELARSGAPRDAVAVAAGGGVTCDLAGFAASIYMRGIPLVLVPTTLLAQADAAIGGKTGVNHGQAKNLAGTFYPARLVVSDPCVLRSLTGRELGEGMAEVVKTALLGAPELLDRIHRELASGAERMLGDIRFLEACVLASARVKASMVARDPFEKDSRKLLNLGHTAGHALEAVLGFSGLTHGRAVSIGLAAALRISVARGLAERGLLDRIVEILDRLGLPSTPPPFDSAAFLDRLRLDKKKQEGRLLFVLPEIPGRCRIVEGVTEDEILSALL